MSMTENYHARSNCLLNYSLIYSLFFSISPFLSIACEIFDLLYLYNI